MPTTRSAVNVPAEIFPGIDDLPADCAALLEVADFCLTPAWWCSVLEAGLPDGAAARFLLLRDSGRPGALLPLLAHAGSLQSLTNPYTCLYRPLLAPDLDAAALRRIGAAMAQYCRAWPSVRLEALAQDTQGLVPLLAGLRAAGLATAAFDHFGNWHAPVAGVSWAQYLATRPGELRETIRRRLRRAERETELEIISDARRIEAGIADYEAVYASSWKPPEPYPRFNGQMMRHAVAIGALRLGVLRRQGQAVAVQLWIVMAGRATVLKLAHDEAAKALSPGTVLTALMIRDLLDRERVTELDFGRGDDPYKRLWAGQRRQRIGVLVINPWKLRGAALLARQWAGRKARGFAPGPYQRQGLWKPSR